ncbi:MAG: alpha/beta fold hydrolase [Phenylobacterium sp.]
MIHRAVLAGAGIGLAAGIVANASALPGIAHALTAAPKDPYAQPGRLALLPDHRRLNFVCLGRGSPTVILESGFGAGAFAWGRVQPRIAAVTRVCAYDRAGYGFSDPGPLPRDGEAIARDLDRGLRAARINGPFVVVGHSAGGLYARLFAARRRADIAGMVFVDPSIEHQPQRVAALFGQPVGGLEGIRRQPLRCLELLRTPTAVPTEADRTACAAGVGRPGMARDPATWKTQLSELDTLFAETSDEVDRTGTLLKGIPAIVLTAGASDGPSPTPEDAGAQAWQLFHRQLAAGFLHGEQRPVKSGHLMMNQRPEVVAGAAIELVTAARKR